MRKLITLLTAMTLTSCAGIEYNTNYIPEIKELRRIENIPYNKKTGMKCLVKAVMYSNHLTSKGIESYVIIRNTKQGLHALVKYFDKNGDAYYSDPTNKGNDGIKIGKEVWK